MTEVCGSSSRIVSESQTWASRGLSRWNSAISCSGVRSLRKGGLGIIAPRSSEDLAAPRAHRLAEQGREHALLVEAPRAAVGLRAPPDLPEQVEAQRAEQGEVRGEVQPLVDVL